MKEAAGNLEFEEAARLRDEIKRLQAVALAVGDDPLARQADVEATAGAYAGERTFGRAANLPSTRPAQADRRRHGPAQLGRRRSPAEGRGEDEEDGGGSPSPDRERGGGEGRRILKRSRPRARAFRTRESRLFNPLRRDLVPGVTPKPLVIWRGFGSRCLALR